MKSNHIQRAVHSTPSDHVASDAPKKERYSRMPGTGLPKGERRKKMKGESRRGKQQRKVRQRIVISWSILLSGIMLVVLGIIVVLWILPKMKPHEEISVSSAKIPAKAEIKTKVVSKFTSPTSAQALALVKRALAVREPDKVAEYFRPDGARPQEVIDFLQGMDAIDGQLDGLRWLSSIGTTAIPLEGVFVTFKSIGEQHPRSRVALITPDDAGKWKIDYNAFARTVTPSWTELLEKQAAVAMVRVCVNNDAYYNGPFIDEKQWICYAISSPDTKEILSAYCKIGSPQAAAISCMISKGAKIIRATLEIRRVAGAESRQFEISKVLAEDWVLGPTPFDEGFK